VEKKFNLNLESDERLKTVAGGYYCGTTSSSSESEKRTQRQYMPVNH
jgi:hypothetical protein